MGNVLKKENTFVNFDFVLKNKQSATLINTMPLNFQDCLIESTIAASCETQIVNQLIDENKKDTLILLYGKNHTDLTVHEKRSQLLQFGFSNIKIYLGGMFEWLLLQDIYGIEEFPTSGRDLHLEILNYK
jgi:hypothetical protein